MNTNTYDFLKEEQNGGSVSDTKEKDLLVSNLFRPPKNDTNYFYYTEVISDWVYRK
jgi:hypothetical protein